MMVFPITAPVCDCRKYLNSVSRTCIGMHRAPHNGDLARDSPSGQKMHVYAIGEDRRGKFSGGPQPLLV